MSQLFDVTYMMKQDNNDNNCKNPMNRRTAIKKIGQWSAIISTLLSADHYLDASPPSDSRQSREIISPYHTDRYLRRYRDSNDNSEEEDHNQSYSDQDAYTDYSDYADISRHQYNDYADYADYSDQAGCG